MQRNKVESWKPTCGIQFMLNPRTLGIVCVGMYLLAMCLPAIASKSYYRTYLLDGWEVTYMCAVLSFAPSMNLGERAPFIVLSHLLWLRLVRLRYGDLQITSLEPAVQ